jgi:hypothetical protein
MVFDAMFLNPDGFNLGFLPLAIAAIGTIVGTLWLRRIAGPDPDKEPSFWRYRQVDKVRRPSKVQWLPTAGDALMDLNEFMAESNARARRGRAAGRWMIFGVLVVLAFMVFVWIASPNFIGGYDAGPLALTVPAIGVVGLVVGFIWMVRIFRADPEPKTNGWRYRD